VTDRSGGVVLGTDVETGQDVLLEHEARSRGLYVIGKNGTGKTTFLLNLLLHDITHGHGCCFIDPHGDAANDLLARIPADRADDVILLDASDRGHAFGINFYRIDDPTDELKVSERTDEAVQIFKKLWGEGENASWGPRLEDLLYNVSYSLIENPGFTMADIPLFLEDSGFRRQLVRNVTNPEVQRFWRSFDQLPPREQEVRTESTLNKVRIFVRNPLIRRIVGQPESTVDFRAAMDEGAIVIVRLARGMIGDGPANLLGAVTARLLLTAALSRADTRERRPFFLYADEYHRFATPDFADLIDEARKYGIATTIAHQRRSQLDHQHRDAPLGAVNIVVFGINGEDAEELKVNFDAKREREVGSYQAKKVLSQQPVQDLVRSPREDARLRELVRDYLEPLVRRAEEYRRSQSDDIPEISYSYNERGESQTFRIGRESVGEAVRQLNAYLVGIMEGRIQEDSSAADCLVGILVWLRGYIGLKSEYFVTPQPKYLFEGDDTIYPLVQSPVTQDERAALRALVHEIVGGTAGHTTTNLARVIDATQLAEVHKTFPYTTWERQVGIFGQRFAREYGERWTVLTEEEQLEFFRARCQEAFELVSRPESECARRFVAQWGTYARWDTDMPRARWHRRLFLWILTLLQLAELLRLDPVYVTSTELEPVYRDRSIADIRNELANTLSNLDDYIAYCKLLQGLKQREYTILTLELPPHDAETGETTTAAVRERSRQRYARPWTWIDGELKKRQGVDEEHQGYEPERWGEEDLAQ
jgi:hypothetical protein